SQRFRGSHHHEGLPITRHVVAAIDRIVHVVSLTARAGRPRRTWVARRSRRPSASFHSGRTTRGRFVPTPARCPRRATPATGRPVPGTAAHTPRAALTRWRHRRPSVHPRTATVNGSRTR